MANPGSCILPLSDLRLALFEWIGPYFELCAQQGGFKPKKKTSRKKKPKTSKKKPPKSKKGTAKKARRPTGTGKGKKLAPRQRREATPKLALVRMGNRCPFPRAA